MTISAQPSYL